MLKGIFTPNLVPFLDDGRINEAELRRMINWLIEKGVNGLYPNGSTGEFIRLSFEERKRVIQIVRNNQDNILGPGGCRCEGNASGSQELTPVHVRHDS